MKHIFKQHLAGRIHFELFIHARSKTEHCDSLQALSKEVIKYHRIVLQRAHKTVLTHYLAPDCVAVVGTQFVQV